MLKKMRRAFPSLLLTVLFTVIVLTSCTTKPPHFSKIAEEFVLNTLTFWPATATAVGYHRHNGVPLDELLDEFSTPALDRQRLYYQRFLAGLARDVTPEKLAPEDRVDYELVKQRIALALFDLDEAKSWQHNPMGYVEVFGNALFVPYVQEYAPRNARFYQILKRLERFPSRVEQAKANLKEVPPFWAEMAISGNAGNLALIAQLKAERPGEMSKKFDAAADAAVKALEDFNQHLRLTPAGPKEGWRLGAERYKKKFQLHHATTAEPADVLKAAEAEIAAIQREMAILSGWKAGSKSTAPQAIRAKLDSLAAMHAKREDYSAAAEADLKEAIAFVKGKDLMPLPDTGNLKVIPTPAFMRGSYPVGGFNPAPAMQPTLGAQYWLTPIPADWPADRVESKLREYNKYGLKILTIHEAMPGHYVQFEFSNRIEPRGRRLLRSVYANGAFAEGWAIYSTEVLIDQGYLEKDPNLRLTFLKQQLRAVSNTVLDIKFHTQNWSEDDALKYLLEETYQEREEATAKIQRAKLGNVQLTEYFAGYRDHKRLLQVAKQAASANFNLREYHTKVLNLGAIPVSSAARLLFGRDLP